MTGEISNHNAVLPLREPDAHGQAAMLLAESLIHGLIERKVLSVSDAIEIIEVATEVKSEVGPDMGDSPENLQKSINLPQAISASLRQDIPIPR